jgi:hypothetical protein
MQLKLVHWYHLENTTKAHACLQARAYCAIRNNIGLLQMDWAGLGVCNGKSKNVLCICGHDAIEVCSLVSPGKCSVGMCLLASEGLINSVSNAHVRYLGILENNSDSKTSPCCFFCE